LQDKVLNTGAMADNPKVFISYAGEDKDRFVLPFAERLVAKGVNIWAAFWDMLPGDKLVSKIFDEGLTPSDAVIVVLSKFSVDKPWVREELDFAKIRQIEDQVRLIPVKIEPCEVPASVRTTLWEEIVDLSNYDSNFERILNSIYGQYTKPLLGPKPAYVSSEVLTMGGLAPIDSVIFEHACRIAIKQGHSDVISGEQVVSELSAQGISEAQILETEEVLEGRGYIRIHLVMGPRHAYDFAITTFGFDKFVQEGIQDYGNLCGSVATLLVREECHNNTGVAQTLGQPIRVIDHILEALKESGLIKFQTTYGGAGGAEMWVHWVSPELRRKLSNHE
jgi:hypothetical protein